MDAHMKEHKTRTGLQLLSEVSMFEVSVVLGLAGAVLILSFHLLWL
jgi:hypothetical protein